MIKHPCLWKVVFFFTGVLITACRTIVPAVNKARLRLLLLPLMAASLYLTGVVFEDADLAGVLMILQTGFFALGFMGVFVEEIMPVITRAHVISYTISFWAVFGIVYLKRNAPAMNEALFIICFGCTALTLFGRFLLAETSVLSKMLLYFWNLFIVAFIGVKQFAAGEIFGLLEKCPNGGVSGSFETLVSGMAFMYLLFNLSAVYAFVTLPTMSGDRAGNWFYKMFLHRIRETPFMPRSVIMVLGVQLLLLWSNHWLNLMPRFLLVDCCLLAAPPLISMALASDDLHPASVMAK